MNINDNNDPKAVFIKASAIFVSAFAFGWMVMYLFQKIAS